MGPAVVRHPDLLFAAFNQDFSCLSVGTRRGYAIVNCEPFGRVHVKNEGPTGLVEMLFCTSLVALVGAPGADGTGRPSSAGPTPGSQARESPRRLQIVNTKRQSTICELLFPTSVLAVKLNRKRMVVVLEEEIYIYDVSTMKLLHTIETSPNPNAICALAPSSENSIIAYPAPLPPPPSLSGVAGSAGGSSGVGAGASGLPPSSTGAHNPASQPGDIVLFDALTLTTVNVIQAHKAPLAQLALNSEGTLLASASETGTVIRVWQVPGAEKVAQFRRGTYPARVCSLNFNLASSLLAVASDSDTIHIYKLPPAATGGGVSSSSSNGGPPPLASHTSTASFDSTTSNTTNGGPSPLPTGSSSSHSPTSSLFRRKTFGLAGSYVGSYLPTGVRDLWTPERDFAHVRLRSSGVRCVVALSPSSPQVFVISETGLFHAYSLDLDKGGECVLIKEFSLITNDDPAVSEI